MEDFLQASRRGGDAVQPQSMAMAGALGHEIAADAERSLLGRAQEQPVAAPKPNRPKGAPVRHVIYIASYIA